MYLRFIKHSRIVTDNQFRLLLLQGLDLGLQSLAVGAIDEAEIKSTLSSFDQLWDCLHPKEQSRIIELLVEQVTYDGDAGRLSITYQPTGFRTLTTEFADRTEEAA